MIPRNQHVGTNSTTLDASFGDPATLALSTEMRIATFLENLRRPWWADAACRGVDTAVFYDASRQAEALQLCGRCPSLEPCRAEALADRRLDFGVRGGVDVAARRNARRSTRPTKET